MIESRHLVRELGLEMAQESYHKRSVSKQSEGLLFLRKEKGPETHSDQVNLLALPHQLFCSLSLPNCSPHSWVGGGHCGLSCPNSNSLPCETSMTGRRHMEQEVPGPS